VRLSADQGHNRWHPGLAPVATVEPGDEVTFACRDGIGDQLTRSSTHADAGRLDLGVAHPITGPVEIQRGSVYLGNANALTKTNSLELSSTFT